MAENKVDRVKKIVIDAGHGRYTAGKRCLKAIDSKETREWALNDRIADKLEILLKGYTCEVLRADDTTGLTDVSLSNRVKKANNWDADVYISIHHNAGVGGKSGGGTVIYYASSKPERKAQAQSLYDNIVAQTKLVGNRSQKVIKKGFYVIKNAKMPAFLIENGFMDSTVDTPIILSDTHANNTALGILGFLVDYLELNEIPDGKEYFKIKVSVPELNYRDGAGVENKKKGVIKKNGIYTIVETAKAKDGSTWGKLKSGAGWINISSKYVSRV